jgi:hypothetical protein
MTIFRCCTTGEQHGLSWENVIAGFAAMTGADRSWDLAAGLSGEYRSLHIPARATHRPAHLSPRSRWKVPVIAIGEANMTKLGRIALAGALAALAGAAQAAEGRFIHPADKNHDDRIDKAEWTAYGLPAADFAGADKNHDGKIDGPEFVAYDQAHRKAGS